MKLFGLPIEFHHNLVLRTPLYSYRDYISKEELLVFYNDPLFQEAVFLAPPVLKSELDKLTSNKKTQEDKIDKVLEKLFKYWVRAHSRTTPFGLFAGCNIVEWHKGSSNLIINKADKLSL